VLHDYALYKSTFTLLTYFTRVTRTRSHWRWNLTTHKITAHSSSVQ